MAKNTVLVTPSINDPWSNLNQAWGSPPYGIPVHYAVLSNQAATTHSRIPPYSTLSSNNRQSNPNHVGDPSTHKYAHAMAYAFVKEPHKARSFEITLSIRLSMPKHLYTTTPQPATNA
uniref:Uncharacterized protein n=1 Tax=Talaromyces marneffei PM1 TaxID=1077442 RepID=A0A093X798_TALMA